MPAKYLVSIPVEVKRAPGEPYAEGEYQTEGGEYGPPTWDPNAKRQDWRMTRRRMVSIPVIADSQNEAERKAQEILTLLVGRAYGSFDANGAPV